MRARCPLKLPVRERLLRATCASFDVWVCAAYSHTEERLLRDSRETSGDRHREDGDSPEDVHTQIAASEFVRQAGEEERRKAQNPLQRREHPWWMMGRQKQCYFSPARTEKTLAKNQLSGFSARSRTRLIFEFWVHPLALFTSAAAKQGARNHRFPPGSQQHHGWWSRPELLGGLVSEGDLMIQSPEHQATRLRLSIEASFFLCECQTCANWQRHFVSQHDKLPGKGQGDDGKVKNDERYRSWDAIRRCVQKLFCVLFQQNFSILIRVRDSVVKRVEINFFPLSSCEWNRPRLVWLFSWKHVQCLTISLWHVTKEKQRDKPGIRIEWRWEVRPSCGGCKGWGWAGRRGCVSRRRLWDRRQRTRERIRAAQRAEPWCRSSCHFGTPGTPGSLS